MTPRDALAEGRLSEALALQLAAARHRPSDAGTSLFLFELLTLAGRLSEARDQLRAIVSSDASWPAVRNEFRRLLRAEHRRTHRGGKPAFLSDPEPHARWRWRAIRALQAGDGDAAADCIDRADAGSPAPGLSGHVDGREFEGLRDTDDRFGSVLEAFVGGEYAWFPWECLHRVRLAPPAGVLDAVFRPAELLLTEGTRLRVVLPLAYPGSHEAGDEFALGRETDWVLAPGGVTQGVGARVLMIGEEELALGECKQIEIRIESLRENSGP
jgi:type VI secretion system protein ImpE